MKSDLSFIQIDSLNSAIDSIITSAKDSLEQMSALINLATLVDEGIYSTKILF